MNYEAMKIALRRMAQEVAGARLEILSRPSHDPVTASPKARAEIAALMAKIDGWRHRLTGIGRHLKGRQGMVDLQTAGRPDYRTRQRAAAWQRNIDTLSAAVEALGAEIDGLVDDLVREDAILKALADAFKEVMEAAPNDAGGLDTAMREVEALVVQADPGGPGGGPGTPPASPVAAFLIAFLAVWALLRHRGDG
ncbi:hypothetical protein DXV76_03240 [Rhodobacteraceae bacterium CCMM004]|nr:hypothetical protein DXV76_03240 [Rhodobacteraceae bacterium CCMM004]